MGYISILLIKLRKHLFGNIYYGIPLLVASLLGQIDVIYTTYEKIQGGIV
jgi:hypothetical protein